ncbi:low molecular weight protein arginine phosphatase [Veillonella agrestimuris]|uniref:low molecular weight protein arginine phosphatase n=1 Tax=Veillonella agrestimuris TaxID=2941340 RepID=UPI00203B3D78|nr:low molecular weight protein arginine phosphatase [Veillonella agrestimuris]
MNILFVCTGNTCRSPMAEGITQALAKDMGLDIKVQSAGLFAAYGAKATEAAILAVQSIADISNHESQPLSMKLVNEADIVIGMTEDHKSVLLRQFPFEEAKIKTLSQWGGGNGDVVDPFGGTQEVYNACAQQIYDLVKNGLQSIKE